MKGLLDELAQKYHAAYLSDLRLNHRINDCVVRELYLFPNKQNYSLWEWSDAVSYVRVHTGTTIPVGSLANHELRTLRRTAHQYFDQLYLSGMMSKQDAYQWLADLLSAPLSKAHIGYLGEYYCKVVIEESRKMLQKRGNKKVPKFEVIQGGAAS